jgi:AraC family transcriptional regulator
VFRQFYGSPPSIYRRQVLVGRAVNALIRSSASFAQVAADAGFCDQSHLSRALRTHTGLTPAQLRSLMRKATSVQ